ncbi:LacI family DNA-binding transcriptional regulator [Herbiconiux sp. SYSU D00978]|uniref:LacI family DNA-binding transcriptional regulator n=1 Tax=Herbiconiux sp. SYSU D00978 TaxID=2812562 RepID=UPI001A967128|nr:LacI family DNA-binding transcriptional regulator [Herbiconiux sp. SYSU D00978]
MDAEKVRRAPSIRDVAKLAGVSHQTVSRVLNDSPSIKPATKQRVLDVMNEVGYRPNRAARALVTSRSNTIGILTAQTTAHYGPTTSVNAIQVAAREAGYMVSTTSISSLSPEGIIEGLEHLVEQSIEGLVVIAPQERVFDAIRSLSIRVPLVTLDALGTDAARSLSVDQIAGARMATRHLIELGHRDIVHVAGPRDWTEAEGRMRGFLDEMRSADLSLIPPVLGDWTAQFGYHAGKELAGFRDFTAVFAANDQMALGILHAFAEAGIRVPEEVSVVGFDDIPEAAHFWPPLTTVRQDFAELGRRAVALLLSELAGESDLDHAAVRPELIVRRSTAPPRGGRS